MRDCEGAGFDGCGSLRYDCTGGMLPRAELATELSVTCSFRSPLWVGFGEVRCQLGPFLVGTHLTVPVERILSRGRPGSRPELGVAYLCPPGCGGAGLAGSGSKTSLV